MNLLIHDLSREEWESIAGQYRNRTVITARGNCAPCTGCFHCWTSGTGVCVQKDGFENMGRLIHEADEMTVMSRYTFGGFSSSVKGIFDRCLGYVLPEFETAYGEMHHKKRYAEEKPVTFIFRGTGLSEEEKEKARSYVRAVCRNLRGTVKEVRFEECAPAVPKSSFCETEKRSGILLVECTMRGRRSNTRVFLERLQAELPVPCERIGLSDTRLPDIVRAVNKAETAVLAMPLYVDGLPAMAVRLMEMIRDSGAGSTCRVYALVNNGLYESKQNRNILNMIKDWCTESGSQYQGALAIGAGEVMGVLMKDKKHVLWPARNAVRGIRQLARSISENKKTEEMYADPYFFARWLYILIANINWQRLKRNAGK